MRKLTALVLAAVIGSVITLGIYKAFDMDQQVVYDQGLTPIELATQTTTHPPISSSSYPTAPVSFTAAAKKSMPAVVHIK